MMNGSRSGVNHEIPAAETVEIQDAGTDNCKPAALLLEISCSFDMISVEIARTLAIGRH